jgi:hypothetical protein
MRWVGHVAHVRVSIGACQFLVRKSEGKRPLGKPRSGWEDTRYY